MIKFYDSIKQMRQHALDVDAVNTPIIRAAENSWFNNETAEETLDKTLYGDKTLVPKAIAALNKLDTQIETPRREWRPSVAGAFPSVPDAIMGRPTPMRALTQIPNANTPVTLGIMLTSTWSVSCETIANRGIATLALLLALTRIRPVTLYAINISYGKDTGEDVRFVRINTNPLDIATAAYALTSAGFYRRLIYGIAERTNGFDGAWPARHGFDYNRPRPYIDGLISRCGFDKTSTLIVPPAMDGDAMLKDPLNWVQHQITRFLTVNADEIEGY